jgi:hypothetical protein
MGKYLYLRTRRLLFWGIFSILLRIITDISMCQRLVIFKWHYILALSNSVSLSRMTQLECIAQLLEGWRVSWFISGVRYDLSLNYHFF